MTEEQVEEISRKIELIKVLDIPNYKILFIVFFAGILGWFYPNMKIKLDGIINNEAFVSEEIIRLYSISIILSKDEKMTVEKLLLWMEKFSKVFKPVFAKN